MRKNVSGQRPVSPNSISREIIRIFGYVVFLINFQMLSDSPTMTVKIRIARLDMQKIWLNWAVPQVFKAT